MERFWIGKALQQNRLRERLQRAAARPLHDAGQQNDSQRRGRSAEERGDGENDDAGEQKALAAKAPGKPVGGGQNDRVGHQIAGQHPGGFGVRGRERPGDVGQATEAMAVSSTSIKVGSITETVTSHGFTPWVSG